MNKNIITKICVNCEKNHPIQDFIRKASNKRGVYCSRICISCFLEKDRELHKKSRILNLSLFLYKKCKLRAIKKNIEFSIKIEDIIIPEYCPILNIKLEGNTKCVKDNSPSVDRIDNNIGYRGDNIKIISFRANTIKNNGSYEEHMKVIEYMKKAKCLKLKSNNNNFNKTVFQELLYHARGRAKKYNLPINIYYEDIIIPKNCPVFGIELERSVGHFSDCSPTLDRIVPELGYVKENIMIISHKANTIKHGGTIEEHEKICEYIKNNLGLSI